MDFTRLALQLQELLLKLDKTICVAESLTAGNLGAAIASVSGSSSYFEGGLIAYNLNQKVALLGVDESHARTHNCVSARVAHEMTLGARERFKADVAIATTGYAEPSSADGIETPFAFFAINVNGAISAGEVVGENLNRVEMQMHVVERVLEATIIRLVAVHENANRSADDSKQNGSRN